MTTSGLDPFALATFLLAAFALAGCAQAVWLGSRRSRALAWPIDGGLMFRGGRLLGDNKTVRGFVVMVPATGLAFFALSLVVAGRVSGLWPLAPLEYGALGTLAGAGFMLGELPNSFLKRRVGIPPGAPAAGRLACPLFALIDRLDSVAGVLIVLAAVVPVPAVTAICVAGGGALVHAAFSALTFRLGGKARIA